MTDVARFTAEMTALDKERTELDRRLRDAEARGRHSTDAVDRTQAGSDTDELVHRMDDLMTRIRVVEAKLQLARKGRKMPWA